MFLFLVVCDALAPGVAYGCGAAVGEVDIDHDCASGAFDAAVGADYTLIEHHRAVGDVCDSGEYFEFFVDLCGLDEVAVDIGDNGSCGLAAEGVGHELTEISVFTHVEELEVDAVVDVPEHIDVVETDLYGQAVVEVYFG